MQLHRKDRPPAAGSNPARLADRLSARHRRFYACAEILAFAILIAVVATAVVPGNRPAAAQSPDFRWHGSVAQGHSIEVKGVNGDVRAEASGSNEVEVVAVKHARRSNPEVGPHRGRHPCRWGDDLRGLPEPRRARPNECLPGEDGRMNVQNNDVTVRFTVRVPAGVTLIGTPSTATSRPRG